MLAVFTWAAALTLIRPTALIVASLVLGDLPLPAQWGFELKHAIFSFIAGYLFLACSSFNHAPGWLGAAPGCTEYAGMQPLDRHAASHHAGKAAA